MPLTAVAANACIGCPLELFDTTKEGQSTIESAMPPRGSRCKSLSADHVGARHVRAKSSCRIFLSDQIYTPESTMGIERMLHAIPSNCELLAELSRNSIDARDLLYYPVIMPHCARGPEWLLRRNEPPDIREHRVAFLELAKHIISSNPGIEHRGVDLDRRFGWLETLLLKIVENHDDRSVLKIALSGEAVIAEAEKNGLDFPIKWNMARTCREVGAALNDISLSELSVKSRELINPL